MSDHWPMIAGIGAGVAAAAAVGQMIVSAVSLGQQSSSGAATDREIAELKRRLERMQETLRQRGYLDDQDPRDKGTPSSQARRQAQQARTLSEFKELERSLEELLAAIPSRSQVTTTAQSGAPTRAQDSWFNKMMVERGRRFLEER